MQGIEDATDKALASRMPAPPGPFAYTGGVYQEESTKSLKAGLNMHAKTEFNSLGFKSTPDVTTKLMSNVYAAVEARTYDREDITPHWRVKGRPPASEFLSFNNGMLHVPSYLKGWDGYFTDHTPDHFTLAKLPYSFDPDAAGPRHFEDYCQWQWSDASTHQLLEEILGDILLSDPRQRVFYVWTGRGGSGKSSLAEMTESMVGESNRCAVNLKDFATDFGLEAAIGKKLILVAEAGVDARHAGTVTENIKRVTGNDALSIKRKYNAAITTRLDSKILCVSNHLLRLLDDSDALFDRMIPMCFTKKVDPARKDKEFPLKLINELPGIVLKALKGWQRLKGNGFTMPEASESLLVAHKEKGSPILTFIETLCQVVPNKFTSTASLFHAWKAYCQEAEISPGRLEDFATGLISAEPTLRKERQRVKGSKTRGYRGIQLND